jgi:hypothetical protein
MPQSSTCLPLQPNQVRSWDITRLKDPIKRNCCHLYAILDIFNRYVIHGIIAPGEAAHVAEDLIADAVDKHHIAHSMLTRYAIGATNTRTQPATALLVNLATTKTHCRPHIRTTTLYSEAHFGALKYRQNSSRASAASRALAPTVRNFYSGPTDAHCPSASGIGFMTPEACSLGSRNPLPATR